MEAVLIVTPNNLHAKPAIAAMEAGFGVIIDKPLAHDLASEKSIAEAVLRCAARLACMAKAEKSAAED